MLAFDSAIKAVKDETCSLVVYQEDSQVRIMLYSVSSYCYMHVLILYMCVIILLHMCPHTQYTCPHALYTFPHTAIYVSSYSVCVSSYCYILVPTQYIRVLMLYIRVLTLLYTCPHIAIYVSPHSIYESPHSIYVSSYCYIRVLVLLHRHLWTRYVKSFGKPLSGSKKLEIPMEMETSRALKRHLPIFRTRVRKWRSLLCVQVRQILNRKPETLNPKP